MTDDERCLEPAGAADRQRVATTLAAAFVDDPVFAWFFPDADRRRACLPRLFARLFDVELTHGAVLRSPVAEAVSFWRSPGAAVTPPRVFLRQAPALVALFGLRVGRLLAVSRAIEAHLPRGEPFRYAHFVGVDPAAQRSGWGKAMMARGCARAAADGVPVYLETARPQNVLFYQGLGFAVVDEWRVAAGPHFWSLLWRARR